MTVTARLSARAAPAPVAGVVSALRGGVFTVQVSGVSSADIPLMQFVGVSAAPPESYGDLSSVISGSVPPSNSSAEFRWNDSVDLFDVIVQVQLPGSVFTEGQHVYVAVYLGIDTPPADEAVPDAVAGPIVVVA